MNISPYILFCPVEDWIGCEISVTFRGCYEPAFAIWIIFDIFFINLSSFLKTLIDYIILFFGKPFKILACASFRGFSATNT